MMVKTQHTEAIIHERIEKNINFYISKRKNGHIYRTSRFIRKNMKMFQ